MINVFDFKFSIRSGFRNRVWLGIAIVFFSSAASAQTYPVSGVWVATDDRSTGGACLILKQFGIDAALAQPFPRLLIFSKDKRFEVRGDYLAETTIRSVKSATDGGFQITETFANRWRPFSKRPIFKLTVVDPTTIDVAEGKARTRFFKCSSGSSSALTAAHFLAIDLLHSVNERRQYFRYSELGHGLKGFW
jgi:hypothetical protein